MTRRRAVFDASVLVRAAVDAQAGASAWTERAERAEIDAAAPTLIWAEVVHTLLRYVRGGEITPDSAQERLLWLLRLPIGREPVDALAPAAFPRALATGLSGYDAFYLALAEASDATLVTADSRLAAVASKAELIT